MLTTIKKLYLLLSAHERRRAILLLAMIMTMSFLDMIGVASIMPFIAVLSNPSAVETNKYLSLVYQWLNFSSPRDFLFALGLLFFLVFVFSSVFKSFTTYALLRFTYMRDYSIGRRLVKGYLGQSYEWYLGQNTSDLGKTVLSEVAEVIMRALIPTLQLIAHASLVTALLALLLIINPVLACSLVFGLGGVYGAIYLAVRKYLGRIGADRVQANRERFKILQEGFGGIKQVKISGLEQTMLDQFDGPARRFARWHTAAQVANQLPKFALEALAFGSILLVILYLMATSTRLEGILPILAVYAFAGYRLVPSLQQIYAQLANLRYSRPALDQLYGDLEGLAQTGTNQGFPEAPEFPPLSQSIRLENISYTYPNAPQPSLAGLTMTIPANTTIGIVGKTGSGKSTIVDLILGLLTPQSGEFVVDDRTISNSNVRLWQKRIGYVPQQLFLADSTLAANIAFGVPEDKIDDAAIERAARVANLHDFVCQELPDQYLTKVGERGVRLSGGQLQRIGIARALYHDPDVLVLDEATSALDLITERAVMDAVNSLGNEKTIILVAHRLSTVKNCNRIFLLDHGRLKGSGTYAELIASHPTFQAMVHDIQATDTDQN